MRWGEPKGETACPGVEEVGRWRPLSESGRGSNELPWGLPCPDGLFKLGAERAVGPLPRVGANDTSVVPYGSVFCTMGARTTGMGGVWGGGVGRGR